MSKKRHLLRIGVGLIVALGFLLIVYVCLSFVYTSIDNWLIKSLPIPPGQLPESIHTSNESFNPCGRISYDVDNEHEKIAGFFISELQDSGWELVEHKSRSIGPGSSIDFKIDNLLFVNRYRYWLAVLIDTDVDAQGIQSDNSWIALMICSNESRQFVLGFLENE